MAAFGAATTTNDKKRDKNIDMVGWLVCLVQKNEFQYLEKV